jgi:hypothetical protein
MEEQVKKLVSFKPISTAVITPEIEKHEKGTIIDLEGERQKEDTQNL